MVRSASQWSARDLGLAGAMVAVQAVGVRYGLGVPSGLLLLSVAPFVFGRRKWDGEVSAYSVCNDDGRRIAGTFTAEQFDAQLRGGPAPELNSSTAAAMPPSAPAQQAPAPAAVDPAVRRRRALEAAERRARESAQTSS